MPPPRSFCNGLVEDEDDGRDSRVSVIFARGGLRCSARVTTARAYGERELVRISCPVDSAPRAIDSPAYGISSVIVCSRAPSNCSRLNPPVGPGWLMTYNAL